MLHLEDSLSHLIFSEIYNEDLISSSDTIMNLILHQGDFRLFWDPE
jgi:hypothetical protein